MKLFHQLEEQDQHNCIHYCVHMVIEDLLDGSLKLETGGHDTEGRDDLNSIVEEAKGLPEEEQFGFITSSDAADIVLDIAVDMAKKAYYHSDDDLVIHYEELRMDEEDDESSSDEETMDEILETEEINTFPKKGKFGLN